MPSITTAFNRPAVRFAVITFYYLAILTALFVLHGREAFASPAFIYEAF